MDVYEIHQVSFVLELLVCILRFLNLECDIFDSNFLSLEISISDSFSTERGYTLFTLAYKV